MPAAAAEPPCDVVVLDSSWPQLPVIPLGWMGGGGGQEVTAKGRGRGERERRSALTIKGVTVLRETRAAASVPRASEGVIHFSGVYTVQLPLQNTSNEQ